MSSLSYRKDIDGLRALAIVPVVLYHAFPEQFPGGFIGVDVFFVISGYLISGIIAEELRQGSFSLLGFYAKRIRRIFPTLVLVLLSVFLVGWVTLFADEYKNLGGQILASATFSSNFLLLGESGYFDERSEFKPLMHLWSLAIEEQFYVLWPLVLMASLRLKNKMLALVLIFVASLALCIRQTYASPVSAFYLPFTRAWELVLGALLVFLKEDWRLRAKQSANVLSVVGLGLVVLGFLVMDKQSPFPGWLALLPCVGAACLILAGEDSVVAQTLTGRRPLVFIGLISYALYLWHWPLLSYAYIVQGHQAPVMLRVGLVLAALLLATLTLYAVERPVRRHGGKGTVMALSLLLVLCGAIGANTYSRDGYGFRASKDRELKSGEIGSTFMFEQMKQRYFPCAQQSILANSPVWDGTRRCFQSKSDRAVDVILLGDSHAEHLFLGFAAAFPRLNVAYFSQDTIPIQDKMDYREIFDFIRQEPSVKSVILAGYWSGRISEIGAHSSLRKELMYSIDALRRPGLELYLTWGIPDFSFDPRECKYLRFGGRNRCEEERVYFDARSLKYRDDMAWISANFPEVSVINFEKYFCSTRACAMADGDRLWFRDNHHLTVQGSEYLAGKLKSDGLALD